VLGRLFSSINMVALVWTRIRRQVFTWHWPKRGNSFHNFLVYALIMVLTVATVLYIISRITSLKRFFLLSKYSNNFLLSQNLACQ
jgi:hypothetical protein